MAKRTLIRSKNPAVTVQQIADFLGISPFDLKLTGFSAKKYSMEPTEVVDVNPNFLLPFGFGTFVNMPHDIATIFAKRAISVHHPHSPNWFSFPVPMLSLRLNSPLPGNPQLSRPEVGPSLVPFADISYFPDYIPGVPNRQSGRGMNLGLLHRYDKMIPSPEPHETAITYKQRAALVQPEIQEDVVREFDVMERQQQIEEAARRYAAILRDDMFRESNPRKKKRIKNAQIFPPQLTQNLGMPPHTRWFSAVGSEMVPLHPDQPIEVYPRANSSVRSFFGTGEHPPENILLPPNLRYKPGSKLHQESLLPSGMLRIVLGDPNIPSGALGSVAHMIYPNRDRRRAILSGAEDLDEKASEAARLAVLRGVEAADSGIRSNVYGALDMFGGYTQDLYGQWLALEQNQTSAMDRVDQAVSSNNLYALGRMLYDLQAWRTPERDSAIDRLNQYAQRFGLDIQPIPPAAPSGTYGQAIPGLDSLHRQERERLIRLLVQRGLTVKQAIAFLSKQMEEHLFDREFNPKRKKRRGKKKK